MTPAQRSLVFAAAHGLRGPSITTEELLRRWPATDGALLSRELLRQALHDRDPDDLECALTLGYVVGLTPELLPLLAEAARADWHYRHEDVAQALTRLGTDAALPALTVLVSARPAYTEVADDSVALARHALHGLERIGGPAAVVVITAALDDEREPVRANARRMLDRM